MGVLRGLKMLLMVERCSTGAKAPLRDLRKELVAFPSLICLQRRVEVCWSRLPSPGGGWWRPSSGWWKFIFTINVSSILWVSNRIFENFTVLCIMCYLFWIRFKTYFVILKVINAQTHTWLTWDLPSSKIQDHNCFPLAATTSCLASSTALLSTTPSSKLLSTTSPSKQGRTRRVASFWAFQSFNRMRWVWRLARGWLFISSIIKWRLNSNQTSWKAWLNAFVWL